MKMFVPGLPVKELNKVIDQSVQSAADDVNSPPHYTTGSIECIDYIRDVMTPEEYRGYLRGCIIKYQHRLMHKGAPKQNAEKMAWYVNKLVEAL